MLTWNVTYHCKSGQRSAFYQALCDLGIRANSLTEEGNCRYDYYFAAEAPDDLLSKWYLFECEYYLNEAAPENFAGELHTENKES